MSSATPSSIQHQWRIVAILVVAVAAVLGLGYYWFLSGNYAVLTRGVRAEEAAAIVQQLKKDDVPYELRDGGTTILVPQREVDAARLDVSSEELPLKGTVGFELFNQSDMGLTDFAQKVNYQRALQGEIARTIMTMDGIAYARVHIALPERPLFRTTRSEPRAAVTLTPQPGAEIDPQRIAGIQRLVAATVPDLALDQVAILNERGQLLTPEFSDVAASGSDSTLEYNYRQRVMRAIAEAAPRASVEAKVTVIPRQDIRRAGDLATGAAGPRDHAIRVVLFERSAIGANQEEAIRRAVTLELGLNSVSGDQLSFSPAPLMAEAIPGTLPAAQATLPTQSREAAQDRFMATLGHAWTIALSLLGAAALILVMLSLRRHQLGRREALVRRIREHLLIPGGLADAS
jgi:flagellar M-ring protein FliF